MADAEKDPDLEYSPLCQRVTEDGISIQLHIYRIAGGDEGWSMEVVDHQGASTVWNDLFPTDRSAYAEFRSDLAAEGIHALLMPARRALH